MSTMTTHTITTHTSDHHTVTCAPEHRVAKSLLGYGVIAGPAYVTVSLTQALTREGFDLSRHEWSLLANGDFGWVQICNLILAGLMSVAFAFGLGRALGTGRGSRWAPRLVAAYGVCLVAAGAFRADPSLGFPAGTADGPGPVSWHGLLHFVAGGIGFSCIAAACFILARRDAGEGRRGFASFSRATGVLFLAGFAMVASGQASTVANLGFTAAVALIWAWMTAVGVDRYRGVGRTGTR